MNYAHIYKADIANGPGFRCSLFTCGCLRNCPGCFNKEAQDPNFGKHFDEEARHKIFKELDDPHCSGLSILGGEPMSVCSDNRKVIIELCREVKQRYPNKSIYMWSGYTYEELKQNPDTSPVLDYIDYLIDGPFIQEKRDLSMAWRGSTNQRIVDVKNEQAI